VPAEGPEAFQGTPMVVRSGRWLSGHVGEAEESPQRCNRWVSELVHQVTQPLTVMQGLLEDARVPRNAAAPYMFLLEALRRDVDQLSRMVGQIREMAEIECALDEKVAVPLVQSVRGIIEPIAPSAEPHKLKIQIDAPREILVWVSRRRLEWGIQKLISGALRRSPKYGKVRISVSCSRAAAILRVSDQGPDAFTRGLNNWPDRLAHCLATPRKIEGDGLEWALAQWMFQSLGANVAVRNRAKHGCVVTVALPLPVAEGK
jgi:K+-sensing histidine kinase KdpD